MRAHIRNTNKGTSPYLVSELWAHVLEAMRAEVCVALAGHELCRDDGVRVHVVLEHLRAARHHLGVHKVLPPANTSAG